jgi:type II secretory pathway component PulF
MPDPIQLRYQMPERYHHAGAFSRNAGGPRSIGRSLLSILWWLICSAFVIGLFAGFASWLFGPLLGGFPVLLFVVVLIPTIAMGANRVRARRVAAILGYVDQAIRLNLPLGRLLAAAAKSETGMLARRLIDVRASLEIGTPLAAALAGNVPEMPPRTTELIHYAEQIGRLPQALDRLIRDESEQKRRAPADRAVTTWYPAILILAMCGGTSFIGIFAFTKLEAICKDFHLQMPYFSRLIFGWQDQAEFLPLALGLAMLFAWSMRLRETLRIRRRPLLVRGLTDQILWRLPICGSILRERGMADLCTALADATELGYPLEASVARAEALQLNSVLRQRVHAWHEGLAAGALPADAAREAQLPRFLVGMLNTARAGDDLPDILRFVARFYRDRFVVLRELLYSAYLPAVTLLMGVMVAGVMLSILAPLYRLTTILGGRQIGGF